MLLLCGLLCRLLCRVGSGCEEKVESGIVSCCARVTQSCAGQGELRGRNRLPPPLQYMYYHRGWALTTMRTYVTMLSWLNRGGLFLG
jgi:hypothetical protein